MNTQLDLLADARALAGINPQYSLMMRVAHARLRRIAARPDRLAEIAAFADEAVESERQRTKLLVQDMQRKLASPEESARRAKLMREAAKLDIPGETDEARIARIGALHAEGSAAIPVHRAGSALWAALERNKNRVRPHNAKDEELFAALGLVLLIRGMSWRPAIGGRDGIRSIMDGGEGAVREVVQGGQQATEHLLDAAECIYGWQHLKPKPPLRAEWKKAFVAMLPKFASPGGSFVSAKEARNTFVQAHPEFADDVEKLETFKGEYTELKKYAEH